MAEVSTSASTSVSTGVCASVATAKRHLAELYRRVVNLSTDQAGARREFVEYLTDRIETLWMQNSAAAPTHPSIKHFQCHPERPVASGPVASGPGTSAPCRFGEYFLRLVQYCEISGEALVRAVFLLAYFRYRHVLIARHGTLPLTQQTIHRLLLAALVCAAKFGEDCTWSNSHFAKHAAITKREMNLIEAEFLCLIDFQVFVPRSQLADFLKELFRTKPTIKLCHMPFDMAIQTVTVKTLQEICAESYPALSKCLMTKTTTKPATTTVAHQPMPPKPLSLSVSEPQNSFPPARQPPAPSMPPGSHSHTASASASASAHAQQHRANQKPITLDDLLDTL